MDELDKSIVRAMQMDFPIEREPYKIIAQRLDISEDELIIRLREFKQQGKIRKMGAVLQHREVGYKSNVLCVWEVLPRDMDAVAGNMCKHPAVSHCYDRDAAPGWPYNVYTMIHGHSRQECELIAQELAKENNLSNRKMLFTVREWKKTSMKYFCEEGGH